MGKADIWRNKPWHQAVERRAGEPGATLGDEFIRFAVICAGAVNSWNL
jgi:hypothetical protein